MDSVWTPIQFDLSEGNPFQYSDMHAISTTISATETFESGIKARDNNRCVVCGDNQPRNLHFCHIIPRVEDDTWQEMKDASFVPASAKSVQHEARNGIRLCTSHHTLFDKHCYYIRWVPEYKRFVFINHSQSESLEVYHGRAIRLRPGDARLPFHGAFLFHEMRVRGFWPLRQDRAIAVPIPWVDWVKDGDGGGDSDDDGDGGGDGDDAWSASHAGRGGRGRNGGNGHNQGPTNHEIDSGHLHSRPIPSTTTSEKVFIPKNPFTNPAALQALKESFAKQPNWKAAIMEGTTWEGNADENAAKWRRLNHIDV